MQRLTDDELLEELKQRFVENKNSVNELKELNNQLLDLNKKLEESESLKSHFISNITNEIINPFASILGLSKNILEVDKENWKKVFSMVAMIHTEAFNLDFQLKNIFVAAKIEAGEIEPEIMPVDINNLISNVLESFRLECIKKKLEILNNSGDDIVFNTDPEKMKIILSNLLSNAINFSYESGKIEVSCAIDDEILTISVRDYGTGISETNQNTIFERFKRLDTGINSLNRGHGLGLSVNKALIDLLNGKIEIKSQINKGSLFKIKFPKNEINTDGFASDGNQFIFDADSIF